MSRNESASEPAARRAVVLAAAAAFVLSAGARAQIPAPHEPRPASVTVPAARARPQGFGGSSSILSVGFPSFISTYSGVAWNQNAGNANYFYQSSGPSVAWIARVNLPGGAVVDSVELDACDVTSSGSIEFAMTTTDAGADVGAFVTPVGNTGLPNTPGCGLFAVAPSSPPLVVDNAAKNYWLLLDWVGDFTAANTATGIRVHYHLQVSPDPATATFGDVPVGHPQHRFVEALVAAGITAGCGGGNYCPTQPVTRGQMAVFLSVALGLNFPN